MDYTLNAALFICYLRDYLARRAPANLQRLLRGYDCREEARTTRLLLNCLQVLLLLEARRVAALALQPAGPTAALLASQATVVSHALALMDTDVAAELPYGLTLDSFLHCGAVPIRRRVRAANNRLLSANEKYIAAGPELTSALPNN